MAKITKLKTAFAQVPNQLLQDVSLTFKARGLWAYMQSLPDDWDFSVERIAKEGQDGEVSVRSGIKELEAEGYLVRKQTPQSSGGSETEYQLLIPSRDRENRALGNRALGNPPLDIGITNTQNTDKYKSQGAIETAAPGEEELAKIKLAGSFEAFWNLYPRKVGKAAAHKAFISAVKRCNPDEFSEGFKRFLLACKSKKDAGDLDLKFVPHPSTWLTQDRWLDESHDAPEKKQATPHFTQL